MKRSRKFFGWLAVVACLLFAIPSPCPAALVWRRGEGWSWEREGMTSGNTPKEQLEIARRLQVEKHYSDAIGAYRRLIRRWPTATAAQDGYLGLAECLSALDYHYKAFKEYQNLITHHPGSPHFELAVQRQFEIGNLFLGGAKHKVFGLRWFDGLERAVEVYDQVVKNGPYGPVAPDAQFRIGLVHEKQKEYVSAVHAYERALEKYPKHAIAPTAQFQIGMAYRAEAGRAEYDQGTANRAVAAFTDFAAKYPKDERLPLAEKYGEELRLEQTKGLYRIAQFYEKAKKPKAAVIYFNEVIERNPKSDWAAAAQQKVTELSTQPVAATPTALPPTAVPPPESTAP